MCLPSIWITACVLAACAHNVARNDATGDDGKENGAREIQLDNGAGIVTSPGGDRVDWRFVQLPDNKQGTMEIALTWVPPRPGQKLAFDVFDEWNAQVATSEGGGTHRPSARIENAKGKYFIRTYAIGRGDAGTYTMTVDFNETTRPQAIDVTKLEVPDPPKLAAVPPPELCPTPPTRRAAACTLKDFPPCDKSAPDPENPKCDLKAPPRTGRVISLSVQGSDVIVTIGLGSDAGVGQDWTAQVLRGDSDTPLYGSDVAIIRVSKRETIGKVHLTTDQVTANPKVKLSPP
jgi:hypothetical protein